jgi:hypothetical protein
MTIETARIIIADLIKEFGLNMHDMEYQIQLDYDRDDQEVLFRTWCEF